MNDSLRSPRFNPTLAYLVAIGVVLLALATVFSFPAGGPLLPDGAAVAPAPAGPAYETRLARGTEGQLRQIALHLSKMQGGASIGGFPGFEPPEDDDEEYRRKIKDQSYRPEDVNHWVEEINGFLKWIVRKNPGLSLKEILQKQGLSQAQIDHFIEHLQRAHNTARAMSGYGVNPETAKTLESLMETLGVPIWQF